MVDTYTLIQIDQLQPNPFQPRDKIKKEELEDLVVSIKAHGVLEPLVVAQTPAGYQIIAGERRWRAAKEAGLAEIPAIVKKTTPRGMLEMAIIENVQRTDLSPIERAQAFQQLSRDFGHTVMQIAEQIGKSAAYVSNTLRLLELPDALKDGLMSGLISEGHARALLGLQDDEKAMVDAYKTILKEGASVRRAEELVRIVKEHKDLQVRPFLGRPKQVSPELLKQWQTQLNRVLHRKSQVKLVRSSRQTKLSITLIGTPEQTQTDLEKIMKLIEKGEREN